MMILKKMKLLPCCILNSAQHFWKSWIQCFHSRKTLWEPANGISLKGNFPFSLGNWALQTSVWLDTLKRSVQSQTALGAIKGRCVPFSGNLWCVEGAGALADKVDIREFCSLHLPQPDEFASCWCLICWAMSSEVLGLIETVLSTGK